MRVSLRCLKHGRHVRFLTTGRHASTIASEYSADDRLLRQVFDAPTASWRKSLTSSFQRRTGLFDNQYLSTPEGFPRYATDSLRKAQFLATYVSENHASMSSPAVIKAFDRLSDTLCCVLDLAEFVRNSHPDERYVQAAEAAYDILYGFMNTLNTHTGLFAALSHISNSPDRFRVLNAQERAVLDVLLADFYRSGVHLDEVSRTNFVRLSTQIAHAERKAFTDYSPETQQLLLSVEDAKGLWPSLNTGMMTADGRHIRVPTSGWEADSAMQRLDNGGSRKRLLEAMQTPRPDQIENMNDLFRLRGNLAKIVGKDSYGSSILAKQMAKSPSQVEAFLLNLAQVIRPKAQAEIAALRELKRRHLRLQNMPELHKWDEDYYSAVYLRNMSQTGVADLSPYLSVGTVIQGLSRIFEHLYGVRFVPREIQPGEGWHSDVRRLDVVSDTTGLLGTLYCDLFSRPGKDSGLAAHFTVRCGRCIDDDALLPGESIIDSGMLQSSSSTTGGKTYQLPVIALQCDFTPARGNSFASLSFHEVHTLFHEMGHAMHSMLGTTDFQTVSGTRVAADFVELPSQIMESFAESKDVWPVFARHHSTDEPAPFTLLQKSLSVASHLTGVSRYRQFIRSFLDQKYHSHLALSQDFDSTKVLRDVECEFGLTCPTDHVSPWHVQFTHLAGYGGTYYSYIFDKAIADRIFNNVFSKTDGGPLSRRAGEKFKSQLLKHGGSKDPWHCLADVLDSPNLAPGDTEAMRQVGLWSLQHLSSLKTK